jgi:tetratricopeptide (TPR) repeat protein
MPRLAAIVLLLAGGLSAQTWTVAANGHFEVYSQAGEERARATLTWLERLRGFLVRDFGITPDRLRPARVIAFASVAEYTPYRLSATADAFYVGTEGRDYIVLSLGGPRATGNAAHEYAHMALHSAAGDIPRWLSEGLAEVFSALGGDRPEHAQALRRTAWMPLADLLRVRNPGAGIYYAEAWALTDMLALSPAYSGKLRALAGALGAMLPDAAFASVYGRSLDQMAADLRVWIDRRKTMPPIRLDGPTETFVNVSAAPAVEARRVLAQMLLDAGQTDRAAADFHDLPGENGDVQAALGLIALLQGNRGEARERWTRALALGVHDDALCYRYAALSGDADVRPVLERAVAIRPDFDDALYSLALLEKNAGDAQAALDHLRAMRPPGSLRAFAYWSAISDALNTLNRHDEAEAAARTAASAASTPEERARAAELVWQARTELTVQMAHGKVVTTRVPRRTSDWNPFVEPADDVATVEGALVEIDCSGPATRFIVDTGAARPRLAIPDPARVQMRNAPPEFTCGVQTGGRVRVVYAARKTPEDDGIVRGMEFR